MTIPDLSKLPKHRRDWLEVFSLPAKQTRVMPGTCEACVWGRGEHAEGCAAGHSLEDFEVVLGKSKGMFALLQREYGNQL